MTDDSKVVLRWEIDNVRARFATGKVESEVFDNGGFQWTMSAEKDTNRGGKTNFILKCDAGHNGEWKCEGEVEIRQYYSDGDDFAAACTKERFCFDANGKNWIHHQKDWSWSGMTDSNYCANGKTILEFHINIINSESGKLIADPAFFDAPNEMCNVILKIGDKKLHVSKELLSFHSPVFKTMFFGEFVENGKEEVEIKDVLYEEFIDLMQLVSLGTLEITDRTVLHILKLSDRFQMERVLHHATMYLTRSNKFDVIAKLLIADQYNLTDLKNKCLKSFNDATDMLRKMQASPEYKKFSSDMKAAICDRMMELKLQ